MATDTFNVIEGDGSSNQITLTDDPVENKTVQALKTAIGSQGDASETDTSTDASLLSWVQGLIDTIKGGLEISSWSAGSLSIGSLPNVTIGSWAAGTIQTAVQSLPSIEIGAWSAGDIGISSFPSALVSNNDEVKTTASVNVDSVKLEADDAPGNGVQAIERVDGEPILKVANVIEFDHDATTVASANETLSTVTSNAVTLKGVWVGNAQSADPAYLHFYKGTGNNAGSPDFQVEIPAETGATQDIPPIPLDNGFEVLASGSRDSVTAPTSPVMVTVFHR